MPAGTPATSTATSSSTTSAIRLHGYSPEPMGKAEVRGFYEAIFAAFDSPQLDFHEVLLGRRRVHDPLHR